MLSDAARAQMDDAAARRADGWAGRRPLTDPTNWRTGNDAKLIEAGWEAWSTARVDADENHLGGIVVATDTRIDADTGEITEGWIVRTPFIAVDDWHSRRRITAAELVIPDGLVQPQPYDIVRMIRRLAGYVGGHRQAWLTATDLGALTDAWALTKAAAR